MNRALLLTASLALAVGGPALAAERAPIDLECEANAACLATFAAPEKSDTRSTTFDTLPAITAVPNVVVQSFVRPVWPPVTIDIRQTLDSVTQRDGGQNGLPIAEVESVIDHEAIAARDVRMFDTLTQQLIAFVIADGLENDGETTSAERRAVEDFFAARDFAPVFVNGGLNNHHGQALQGLFETADSYGLNPVDFENPHFLRRGQLALDAYAAARADINMALWALRYARHAQTGRVNPADISPDITLARNVVDPATVLPALLASGDVTQALLGYHPQHAQFHALREELGRLRARGAEAIIQPIAEGGTLRLGDSDPRVPLLRARLGLPDPTMTASIGEARVQLASTQSDEPLVPEIEPADPNLFDEALDEAVKSFQADHNLTADGIVGPATFAALNEQAGDLTPHIIANMERWRWMPRDLGDFHVLANVPEYRLWVRRNGETIFTTRTVVGQPRHRTAIFSDAMEYISVNPYWNVPSSIARNELLPHLLQDPGYAHRGNYEVLYNGQSVDPFAIDWRLAAEHGLSGLRLRQRPGRGNALGEIKFMFPNQHAIYFHDTPSRSLFARDQRAFSHGCVRVLDPWAFAEALLSNEPNWDLADARGLQGPRERNLILDSHIPVHLTYFTARMDEDGRLIMARDLYGHHGRVLAALGLPTS